VSKGKIILLTNAIIIGFMSAVSILIFKQTPRAMEIFIAWLILTNTSHILDVKKIDNYIKTYPFR